MSGLPNVDSEKPITTSRNQEANSPITSSGSLYLGMDRDGAWSIKIRQNKYKVSAVVSAIVALVLMIYGTINIRYIKNKL